MKLLRRLVFGALTIVEAAGVPKARMIATSPGNTRGNLIYFEKSWVIWC